jgi:hypothetical protein
MLKVSDTKAGTTVTCAACMESAVVPSDWSSYIDELGPRPAPTPDQPRGLFTGLRGWLRWAVVLVAAVGILNLLLAVAGPFLPVPQDVVAAAQGDMLLVVPACLVLFLVLVYAGATTCPACGKWWARTEGETSSLSRHVSEEGGVRRVRSTQQTTYVCKYCRHTWAATFTEEYQGAVRPRRGGRSSEPSTDR